MTNNTSGVDFARHLKSITEWELWEIMYTRRGNVNNIRVTDDVINCDKTEYFSHTIAEVMDGKHKNYWILIMKSSTGKWWYYQDLESNEVDKYNR